MAITVEVTHSDDGVKKIQEDRYLVSAHLKLTDTVGDVVVHDNDVSVVWDGGSILEVRTRLGIEMQGIVARVEDNRAKHNSAAYGDMITWLNANLS